MSVAASLPMASAAGLSQFERERLARLAMIQAKMQEIMEGVDTSLIRKQPRVPKTKAAGPKKRKAAADMEVRRSSRIHNLPVPLYCIEEDPTEGSFSSRRHSTTPGNKGPNGRRCHGASAAPALFGAEADPYMVPPLGWKSECGSAGLAAAEAATDAALAFARQLNEQGTPAVVKLMSASQVSGGFWCQLPIDIGPYYGTDKQQHKRPLTLHCFDKAQQDPEEFLYAQPGSSTRWTVVHLPKGENHSCGLSGGWRGFAIDQRIFPNDTVVFACLDKEPTAPAPTAAAVAGDCSASAATAAGKPSASSAKGAGTTRPSKSAADGPEQQQQQLAGQGGSTVTAAAAAGSSMKPSDRMHMQAYIFRAFDYETDSSKQQLQQPPTPQQAAGAAALPRMGSLTPGASSQQQQQQQSDDNAAGSGNEEDILADIPLAKRAKLSAAPEQQQQQHASGVVSPAVMRNKAASASSGHSSSSELPSGLQLPLSPEQRAVQQLGLMEAAEAGVLRVKVSRQGSSSGGGSARKPPAAETAAGAAQKRPAADVAGEPRQKKRAAAAGASGVAQKRPAADAVGVKSLGEEPRQKRAAAASASKAWGSLQQRVKGSSNGSSSSDSGSGRSKKAPFGVQLVPKPAVPSQMVPAPTKAEAATALNPGSYQVEHILAHRVNAATGDDEFLISWQGYGPYWDSWEGLECLDGPPGCYPWQGGDKAIPRKFRL